MNFFFIVWGSFPRGGAYFNLLISYALGLTDLGHNVKFILLSLSKKNVSAINGDISSLYHNKFSAECIALIDDKECQSHYELLVNRYKSIKNLQNYIQHFSNTHDVALVYGKTVGY